jgi:hypothetical protein
VVEIINSPSFDRQEALVLHRKMLVEKRRRLDKMLETLDKTTRHTKGEIAITNKEKFEGFDFSHNPYEQEARERWGDKAVDAANAKVGSMSKEDQKELSTEMEAIYRKLSDLRHDSPASKEAQAAIEAWYDLLNHNFGNYSLDAFKGLGQMYADDARFTKNIDRFGEGLAVFMRDAMAVFAEANSK